jgi:serine O-acetyltransferase
VFTSKWGQTLKIKNLSQDYEFMFGRVPRIRNLLSAYLFFPGFRAVTLLRIQQRLEVRNRLLLALAVSNLNQTITGAEFCLGAQIGAPLMVRHPAGIVIGGGVVIGNHCILLQGVTLGEKYVREPDGLYPIIGNFVSIGCNSTIIGNVTIGDRVTIGAHTLVLKSVNSGKTVLGTH